MALGLRLRLELGLGFWNYRQGFGFPKPLTWRGCVLGPRDEKASGPMPLGQS